MTACFPLVCEQLFTCLCCHTSLLLCDWADTYLDDFPWAVTALKDKCMPGDLTIIIKLVSQLVLLRLSC
jgi:hypothetical protein